MKAWPGIFALTALFFLAPPALSLAQADELRDPMQPPALALQKFRQAQSAKKPQSTKAAVSKPAPPPLVLTSIIISKKRKIAIIDDQMLAVGDSIKGARVISIERDSARLLRKGKMIKLSLNNDLTAIRKKAVESNL